MTDKPDLLQISPFPPHMVEALEQDFTIHRYFEADDKAAMLDRLKDSVRFVATGGHHGCSAEVIAALPKLEVISSFGVGYDAVDVKAARQHNVRVTNTPDVLNDAVAELTLGMMLAIGPVFEDRQHHRYFAISLNSSIDCRRSRPSGPTTSSRQWSR